jgi:hypothetical protein
VPRRRMPQAGRKPRRHLVPDIALVRSAAARGRRAFEMWFSCATTYQFGQWFDEAGGVA